MSSASDSHDSYDESSGTYRKICHCVVCQKKYAEWKDHCEKEGKITGKKKCYTVCEFKFEREIVRNEEWGHKERYDGEWEKVKVKDEHKKKDKKHKKDKKRKDSKKSAISGGASSIVSGCVDCQ